MKVFLWMSYPVVIWKKNIAFQLLYLYCFLSLLHVSWIFHSKNLHLLMQKIVCICCGVYLLNVYHHGEHVLSLLQFPQQPCLTLYEGILRRSFLNHPKIPSLFLAILLWQYCSSYLYLWGHPRIVPGNRSYADAAKYG